MEEFQIPTAYTFDDILLIPGYSEVVPTDVSTEAFFARDTILKMPIISAAMDTVTEHKVAQIMAQMGGLGIIHKNLSIEAQAFEVEKELSELKRGGRREILLCVPFGRLSACRSIFVK